MDSKEINGLCLLLFRQPLLFYIFPRFFWIKVVLKILFADLHGEFYFLGLLFKIFEG
jgi:hypothetical protein